MCTTAVKCVDSHCGGAVQAVGEFRQGKRVRGQSWVGSHSLQLPDGAIRGLKGAGTEAWGDWNSEAEGSDVRNRWLVE